MSLSAPILPSVLHRRRLRDVWRSAGWPFQDPLEAELLAAGWLARERDPQGHERVRVTDTGVALLAETLQRNRSAHDAHEALVARVARDMQHAGRLVWCGLSLRAHVGAAAATAAQPLGPATPALWSSDEAAAPDAAAQAFQPLDSAAGSVAAHADGGVAAAADWPSAAARVLGSEADEGTRVADGGGTEGGHWVLARPDVFSIRQTSVEDYLVPIAHEVKVRRADLLADLRRPFKGEAYRWLAAECWYVIREGIAEPDEIPAVYGVMVAPPTGALQTVRAAPRRSRRLPFAVWMALARATPEAPPEEAQLRLGEPPALASGEALSEGPPA